MIRTAFLALGLSAASFAWAGDTIMTSREISLRAGYVGQPEAQEKCDWSRELPRHLAEYSDGMVQLTDEDLSKLPGRTLRIHIQHMRTAGGGIFSGPKWAAIRADLYQDGTLIGQFQQHRRTMTIFNSACGSLDKIADALAADTAQWLRRGQFRIHYPDPVDSIPEIGPPEVVPPIQ